MADRLFLSNDAVLGYKTNLQFIPSHPLVNETSAHGASALMREVFGPMPQNGRITDFAIGVVLPGVSASGFVSGTATATLRINSAAVCSTNPAILKAGSAGQAVQVATNGPANAASGLVTSAVVNTASANFSAGDFIAFDWDAQSGGSAAAGAAGKGMYTLLTVTYTAT